MTQIGPYKIEDELGRGGMGIVYRAVDPVIGRTVAIKTVHAADLGGDPVEQDRLKERLFREAKSAGILSHPGIVTIYQAGQDNDVLFIAMEFIDGPNLAVALSRTRPSVELTLQLLKQAAEALDYAHSKGVIHRDIKPANLLLQSEGRVKIADFGIAKLAASNLTRTGTTVGSPAYMSPEQIRATAMDGRADQYSLAVLAYEMLTGKRPYESETITSLVFKIVFEQPDMNDLHAVPGGERMEPVLRKAISKSADDRYPNCMAFWQALSDAATAPAASVPVTATIGSIPANPTGKAVEPASVSPPPTPPAKPAPVAEAPAPAPAPVVIPVPAPPKRGGLMIALGLGALLVAAGGGYWFMGRPNPKPAVDATNPPATAAPATSPVPVPVASPGAGPKPAQKTVIPPASPEAKSTPPELISRVEGEYTPEAHQAGIEGTVTLKIVINEKGLAEDAVVAKTLDPGLDRSALEAIKKWRFKPATMNGKPVAARTQVEFNFTIAK